MKKTENKTQNNLERKKIFKRGSKTYYNSSVFFPKKIRADVFILYAYVRTADDFVDSTPQRKKEFIELKKQTFDCLKNKSKRTKNKIINDFLDLAERKKFKKEWTISFLGAMEADLYKNKYKNMKELEEYMHGSAEVIGLFMAKIMDLPEESYNYAAKLGKAMQYINFIRDIKEDIEKGRIYLPELTEEIINNARDKKKKEFENYIKQQIIKYLKWQKEAEKGFKYIPRKYRIPIRTASDMYLWTAKKIYSNPLIVLEKQVKPSKTRIIINLLKRVISC